MSERINHLAVWVAAIAYFLFGWVWYTVFGAAWMAAMGKTSPGDMAPLNYLWSFLMGLILAYATAIALARRAEDQTLQQGVGFALFMGIALFATQTFNQVLYAGMSIMLWLINTGYVVVGFAIIGAIVGVWKKQVAAAA
jgi:hypothetical protein